LQASAPWNVSQAKEMLRKPAACVSHDSYTKLEKARGVAG